MRAFLSVADEPGPVKRRGGGDAIRIARCRGQGVGAAHAVAVAPDRPPFYLRLAIDKGEHRGSVIHNWRNRHLGADGPHARALRAALLEDVRPKNRIVSGTVVKIG